MVEKVRLVNSFDPEKSIEVEAVIDTGATMIVLPKNLVETLGLKKVENAKVKYADGSGGGEGRCRVWLVWS